MNVNAKKSGNGNTTTTMTTPSTSRETKPENYRKKKSENVQSKVFPDTDVKKPVAAQRGAAERARLEIRQGHVHNKNVGASGMTTRTMTTRSTSCETRTEKYRNTKPEIVQSKVFPETDVEKPVAAQRGAAERARLEIRQGHVQKKNVGPSGTKTITTRSTARGMKTENYGKTKPENVQSKEFPGTDVVEPVDTQRGAAERTRLEVCQDNVQKKNVGASVNTPTTNAAHRRRIQNYRKIKHENVHSKQFPETDVEKPVDSQKGASERTRLEIRQGHVQSKNVGPSGTKTITTRSTARGMKTENYGKTKPENVQSKEFPGTDVVEPVDTQRGAAERTRLEVRQDNVQKKNVGASGNTPTTSAAHRRRMQNYRKMKHENVQSKEFPEIDEKPVESQCYAEEKSSLEVNIDNVQVINVSASPSADSNTTTTTRSTARETKTENYRKTTPENVQSKEFPDTGVEELVDAQGGIAEPERVEVRQDQVQKKNVGVSGNTTTTSAAHKSTIQNYRKIKQQEDQSKELSGTDVEEPVQESQCDAVEKSSLEVNIGNVRVINISASPSANSNTTTTTHSTARETKTEEYQKTKEKIVQSKAFPETDLEKPVDSHCDSVEKSSLGVNIENVQVINISASPSAYRNVTMRRGPHGIKKNNIRKKKQEEPQFEELQNMKVVHRDVEELDDAQRDAAERAKVKVRKNHVQVMNVGASGITTITTSNTARETKTENYRKTTPENFQSKDFSGTGFEESVDTQRGAAERAKVRRNHVQVMIVGAGNTITNSTAHRRRIQNYGKMPQKNVQSEEFPVTDVEELGDTQRGAEERAKVRKNHVHVMNVGASDDTIATSAAHRMRIRNYRKMQQKHVQSEEFLGTDEEELVSEPHE